MELSREGAKLGSLRNEEVNRSKGLSGAMSRGESRSSDVLEVLSLARDTEANRLSVCRRDSTGRQSLRMAARPSDWSLLLSLSSSLEIPR